MKSQQGLADGGSIPPTSTTEGVLGFDVGHELQMDRARGDRRNRRKTIDANDAIYVQAIAA